MAAKVLNCCISASCLYISNKVYDETQEVPEKETKPDGLKLYNNNLISAIAIGIIFGLGKIFIYNALLSLAFPAAAVSFATFSLAKKIMLVAKIISSVILAPVIEEKIFRKIMLPLQIEKDGKITAIFKNALLFGGMHFILGGNSFTEGLKHAIFSAGGGLIYASAATYTQSYLPSIIAHSMSNLSTSLKLVT